MRSQRSSNVKADRDEVLEWSSGPVPHLQRGQGKGEETARKTEKIQPTNWKEISKVWCPANHVKEVGSMILSKIWMKNWPFASCMWWVTMTQADTVGWQDRRSLPGAGARKNGSRGPRQVDKLSEEMVLGKGSEMGGSWKEMRFKGRLLFCFNWRSDNVSDDGKNQAE